MSIKNGCPSKKNSKKSRGSKGLLSRDKYGLVTSLFGGGYHSEFSYIFGYIKDIMFFGAS